MILFLKVLNKINFIVGVLEHDNLKRGLENYDYVKKISKLNKSQILEILNSIDKFGGPKLMTIGDLNNVSLSSLRYL